MVLEISAFIFTFECVVIQHLNKDDGADGFNRA